MIRGGVDLDHAQAAQFVFETVASAFAAGQARGGRNSVGFNGLRNSVSTMGAGDAAMGGARERVAGMIVKPVEDFHMSA